MTGSARDFGGMALVAGLASAFGVFLLHAVAVLTRVMTADQLGSSATVQTILSILALLFLGIALYVGSVVISNTMAVVVAGRTQQLSLLRLLGASSVSLRSSLLRECLAAALVGIVAGALTGYLLTCGIAMIAVAAAWLPPVDYWTADGLLVIPLVLTALVVLVSSWRGTRAVLRVSPIASLGSGRDAAPEPRATSRARRVLAVVLAVAGVGLLAAGVVGGFATPAASLLAMIGAFVSYGGVLLIARDVFPRVAALVARLFGTSSGAQLATAQVRERAAVTAGAVGGLATGVAVVTTFAVGAQTYVSGVVEPLAQSDPAAFQVLWVTVGIVLVMTGFSIVLAAVGLVNNTVLTVVQRRHELGLLRVLGLGTGQVRWMLLVESAASVISATVVGLLLGSLYGWAGVQSLMGSLTVAIIPPVVPLWLPAGVLVVAVALALLAMAVTVRRTLAVSPIVALGAE